MTAGPFYLSAACVTPLSSPTEFYDALLRAVVTSEQRLTLASLYIGTGPREKALVEAIRRRLEDVPALRVHGQFDYSRSLRLVHAAGEKEDAFPSPADLLMTLFDPATGGASSAYAEAAASLRSRVTVGLTRLPVVRGWLASWLPQRVIEGAGVWHVKAYVADGHTILLSGANLSADYFHNRQDRYLLIRSPTGTGGQPGADDGVAAFAQYLHDTLSTIGALPGAHVLVPVEGSGGEGGGYRGVVTMLDEDGVPARSEEVDSPTEKRAGQVAIAALPRAITASLNALYEAALARTLEAASHPSGSESLEPSSVPPGLCRVTPRLQYGPAGVRHDERHTLGVLADVRPAPQDTLHLATGYFNVTDDIATGLVMAGEGRACVHVLTASPGANGFLGASGPAGAIPLAYSEMEREFLEGVETAGRSMPDPLRQPGGSGVAVHEYGRPGWTFHGKGLWLERELAVGGGGSPRTGMVSLVGSPNFGARSAERDVELQVCLVTQDEGLTARLANERDGLWGRGAGEEAGSGHTSPVGLDVFAQPARQVGGWTWDRGYWIHAGRRILSRFF
jgi:CDP-diacylglycerol--glycerol-3-phosphate 3-phosphatidyltransferase